MESMDNIKLTLVFKSTDELRHLLGYINSAHAALNEMLDEADWNIADNEWLAGISFRDLIDEFILKK